MPNGTTARKTAATCSLLVILLTGVMLLSAPLSTCWERHCRQALCKPRYTNVNSPTVTPAHMLIGWGLSRSQIRRGVAVVLEKALQTRAVLAERSVCWFKGKDPRPRHPLLPVNPQQVLAHLQRHTESLACHIFIAMDVAPKVDLVQSTWQIQAPLNACACILEHHSEKHQVRLGKGQP